MGWLPNVAAAGLGLAARSCTAAGTAMSGAERAVATGARTVEATARALGSVAAVRRPRYWKAGDRLHVPLRASDAGHPLPAAAHALARELAGHPEVLTAYWDGGLSHLVVQLTQDAVADRVVAHVDSLAQRHGLDAAAEPASDSDSVSEGGAGHPGGVAEVRVQALGVALDAVGLGVALSSRMVPLGRSPRLLAAAAGLLREDPAVERVLRRRLGPSAAQTALAGLGAAAQGMVGSPVGLALDGALRMTQLAGSLARAAAFVTAHDRLCAPECVSQDTAGVRRPAMRPRPEDDYRGTAVRGAAVGAAGPLLFAGDWGEAAEALQAGSPRAARFGPAAFTAALAGALAGEGVLVRGEERLRRLASVDTVVLDASALHGRRRTVLEVFPSAPGWEASQLWQAAFVALRSPGGAGQLTLRPVPDEPAGQPVGLMIAASEGRDVGTVQVGWDPDPLAASALDAARRADLLVVVVDDGTLGDLGALADRRVEAGVPLAEVVRGLRKQGRTVLTVAQVPQAAANPADEAGAVLSGLLGSDLAVALATPGSAVVWAADVLLLDGLPGAWRLIAAIPGARAAAARARLYAESGAALSGLLVLTRGRGPGRPVLPRLLRLGPVDAAAVAALVSGWRLGLQAAARRVPHPRARIPWHALQPGQAQELLAQEPAARPGREVAADAVRRVAQAGALLPLRLTARLFLAVRAELADPLTPLLTVGAAATALLGSPADAVLVTAALGVNALVGAVQRMRAERSLSRLEDHGPEENPGPGHNGSEHAPQNGGLTPGQILDLRPGQVVPADGRLLESVRLEVDESALTGESLPSMKRVDAAPLAPVAERHCMVFEGTTVVAGTGRAVVVETGADTEAGRAVHLAARTGAPVGMQRRLHELTRRVLPFTFLGGAAVTALSLARGRPVGQAARSGLAVTVAAVPEGLPLVATVAQQAAARRLERQGVLVRSARTLEALGRADVVCFDKTGTLTRNRLRVVRTATGDGHLCPPGSPAAATVLSTAARACLSADPDDEQAPIDPTDTAIVDVAPPDPGWRRLEELPFSADRSYTVALGEEAPEDAPDTDADQEAGGLLVVKGAPEALLPACGSTGTAAQAAAEELAHQGLRVLAVAVRRLPRGEALPDPAAPLPELTLVGFVGLADSARDGSAELVAQLRASGVRPVVLTGDHPRTAQAVARELGWPERAVVVTGQELTARDRPGRARLLDNCDVIARVAPQQKLQVVEALREAGHVVAMVGDGANDAAAIRAADIGIALAAHGSPAARNAADLVLTGDELAALAPALAEGRALWQSVADATAVLVGGNAGEITFSVLGTLASGAAPLTARQMLLVNLFTDLFPAMALAVTPRKAEPDRDAATSPPGPHTPPTLADLGGPLLSQIAHRGAVTALGAGTAWLLGALTPGTARRTSTMALCGVVGAQLLQTLHGRSHSPLVVATALGSAAVLVLLVQTPGVSHALGCTPLGPVAWLGVAAGLLATRAATARGDTA